MNPPDLKSVLDDVQTIKSILQTQDAPLPRVWLITRSAALAIVTALLLQTFVPLWRDLDFDGRLIWLWLPGFALMLPLMLLVLARELRRSGRTFLGQGRIQHLLYARFIIPPAALTVIWAASRNPVVPVEGVFLVTVSMWQAAIEQALPAAFRPVPFVFLGLGLLEMALGWRGELVILANGLLAALTITYAGELLRYQARRPVTERG